MLLIVQTRRYLPIRLFNQVNWIIALFTSYDISGGLSSPVIVKVANSFEEYKVTYTEYDDEGIAQGNVEFEYKVE